MFNQTRSLRTRTCPRIPPFPLLALTQLGPFYFFPSDLFLLRLPSFRTTLRHRRKCVLQVEVWSMFNRPDHTHPDFYIVEYICFGKHETKQNILLRKNNVFLFLVDALFKNSAYSERCRVVARFKLPPHLPTLQVLGSGTWSRDSTSMYIHSMPLRFLIPSPQSSNSSN